MLSQSVRSGGDYEAERNELVLSLEKLGVVLILAQGRERGLEGRVRFLGAVPPSELAAS